MTKQNLLIGGVVLVAVALVVGYMVKPPTTLSTTSSETSVSESVTQTPVVKNKEAFDSTAAEEEAYWYSRYNLGSLVMKSGLGEKFKPDKKVMAQAMKMVDADFDKTKTDDNYGDKNHPKAPKNPALLRSVYKSGDPHLTTKLDVNDFLTQRWDAKSFDKQLTGLSSGWTIIKEIEWAKQFHVDSHFGTPKSSFGAQWRFVGMVMNMEAKMQTEYFLKNKSKFDLSNGGDYVMLWALSDLGKTLQMDQLDHSTSNRYKDVKVSKMFLAAADIMFGKLKNKNPSSIKEKSLGIQSLVWYAKGTSNLSNKAQALKKIKNLSEGLKSINSRTATEKAYALRGLIEAKRVVGIKNSGVSKLAIEFLNDFDNSQGIFKSQNNYNIDDIAGIIGALNSLRIFETENVDTQRVNEVFTLFFENVVNKSGMQQSVPPIKVAKDPFEIINKPKIYFAYPNIPFPPMAGGKFGISPVFATSVRNTNGKWSVSNAKFDTAGAMHTANEMIWLHYDEINGFPEINILK